MLASFSFVAGAGGKGAETTHLAMKEILSQAHTSPTDSTLVTVVDGFRRSILPQLTYAAVILRCHLSTIDAHI